MCGRSACTLCPDDVVRACRQQNKQGKWTKPKWRKPPGGQQYQPSHNVCPGTHTPILFSKTHADYEDAKSKKATDTESETKTDITETSDVDLENPWVVQPMRWGLVPSWHSGVSDKGIGYNMINARSDGILTKRTFKGPLEKGRRCVVLVDGYFEWQSKDGKKQPHFLYFPRTPVEGVKKGDPVVGGDGEEIPAGPVVGGDGEEIPAGPVVGGDGEEIPAGWEGRRLMTLAGLFDIWRPKDGSPPVYSYSIITVEAHKSLNWLHDRMPAILNGEEEVASWLDSAGIPLAKAVKELIRPVDCLQSHPVSTSVNDNKNKTDECTKPLDLSKQKKEEVAGSNFMKSWLSKGAKRKSTDTDDVAKEEGVSVEKKPKTDDN